MPDFIAASLAKRRRRRCCNKKIADMKGASFLRFEISLWGVPRVYMSVFPIGANFVFCFFNSSLDRHPSSG
jgi:hypothetical protein